MSVPTQPGCSARIAQLALNSTIPALSAALCYCLRIAENVGQRGAVDALLKGRFTPPHCLSQILTHKLAQEFTLSLRGSVPKSHPFLQRALLLMFGLQQ